MNYGSIKLADCANGPGMRVSLFVSGCRNHCEGCFQPETWDFNFGKKFTYDTHLDILTEVMKPFYDGVSILGGDPMEYENEWGILPLIMGVKLLRKTVWVYTGTHGKTLWAGIGRATATASQGRFWKIRMSWSMAPLSRLRKTFPCFSGGHATKDS